MNIARETRIIGPPGTGKTTRLSRMILDSVKSVGSDNVLVASFTKAAAVELAGRNLPIDASQVGTLHALSYRALGQPEIAETKISEWNSAYPQFELTASAVGKEDVGWDLSSKTDADAMMTSFQTQRAKMVPVEHMEYDGAVFSGAFAEMVELWNDWKRACDYFDFQDMIERAYYELDEAPGSPRIMYLDEAQDLAPIELALARKWAKHLDRLVIAGDDDQAIMNFRGASPESIFGGDPSTFDQEILTQSYRVPRAVLELADGWIRQLSWRVEKSYLPRKEIVGHDAYDRPVYGDKVAEGFVKTMWDADFGNPRPAVERAQELIAQGKSVMFLATCSYMLRDACAALKDAGVPFHNPYQRRRQDWNPLDMGSRTRKTAAYRAARYMVIRDDFAPEGARVWDADEFSAWASQIRSDDLFKRGVKTKLASADFTLPSDPGERLGAIGAMLRPESVDLPSDEHFANALSGDLGWLLGRLSGDIGKRMKYPVKIAQTLGPKALIEPPRCVVGTAHSVKGAQADVVFLYPDISRAGAEEWASPGERQDSVRRLAYVAMTRAREGLYLCGNATGQYIKGMW